MVALGFCRDSYTDSYTDSYPDPLTRDVNTLLLGFFAGIILPNSWSLRRMKVSSDLQRIPSRSPQGGPGRCRGGSGEALAIAQAAWILILTLLKLRSWSTLATNYYNVSASLLILNNSN